MTTCCSFGAHLALSTPLVQRDQRVAGLHKTILGRRTKPAARALLVTPSAHKDFAGKVGSLNLAAEQIPAERYIATNRFKVKKGAEAKFEKRWQERKSRLAELDGFQFFTIMQRVTIAVQDVHFQFENTDVKASLHLYKSKKQAGRILCTRDQRTRNSYIIGCSRRRPRYTCASIKFP
jgi:hypothetical protein